MTDAEVREAAQRQNDAAFAAGDFPTRYVEDPGVLAAVARLITSETHIRRGMGSPQVGEELAS